MKNTSEPTLRLPRALAAIALTTPLFLATAQSAAAQSSPGQTFQDAHAAMTGGDYKSAYEKYRSLVAGGRPPEGSGVDLVVVANDLGVISAMSNDLDNALRYLGLALNVADAENPKSVRTFQVLRNLAQAIRRREGAQRAAEYETRMNEIRRGWYRSGEGGTVENVEQQLMWTSTDNGEDLEGHAAEDYCGAMSRAGFEDWRIPMLQELSDVHDTGTSAPVGGIRLSSCCAWAQSRVKSPASDQMVTGLLKINFSGSMTIEDPEKIVARVLCVRDTSPGFAERFPLAVLPVQDSWWETLPGLPGDP